MDLHIKDAGAARLWMEQVEIMDRETTTLIADVGKALQEVNDDADSTFVDDIYHWGTNIVNSSSKILEGMTELMNAVDGALKMVDEVIEKSKGIVKNIVSGIVNKI